MQQRAEPSQGHLILVTGAGRSGTSTVAGALNHLGLHVPLPVLKTNESNPRGFFESTWPLWFHRRIMDVADIEQVDGRPGARALMHEAADESVQNELIDWLRQVAVEADRIVVKDPRASWVPHLWIKAADEVGLSIGFVTMLRHPAEVLGSRSTYYGKRHGDLGQREFATLNLAGWVTQTINTEQLTRGQTRTWIRYDDLLEDWRTPMRLVREATGVEFNHSLEAGEPHPVDDFIDPDLRRHQVRFDDLDLPRSLTEIAEELWEASNLLADRGGADAETEQRFDAAADAYARLYADSAAIVQHETRAQVRSRVSAEAQEAEVRIRRRARKARREGIEQGRTEALAERRSFLRRSASRVRNRLRRTALD